MSYSRGQSHQTRSTLGFGQNSTHQPKQNFQQAPNPYQQQTNHTNYRSPSLGPNYMKQQPKTISNYDFMRGQENSDGIRIRDIIERWNDDQMERNHTYIQWLMPNFFKSKYNPDSYALTLDEVRNIELDVNAKRNYQDGIVRFLKFLGLEIRKYNQIYNNQKGLIVYTDHNQERIRRLIASLYTFHYEDLAAALCNYFWHTHRDFYQQTLRSYDINSSDFDESMVLPSQIGQNYSTYSKGQQTFPTPQQEYLTQSQQQSNLSYENYHSPIIMPRHRKY